MIQKNTRKKRFRKKRNCFFKTNKIEYIDYKNVDLLKKFTNINGKIITRKITGTSAKFQRQLATAIKRARYMALIPYTNKHK